MKKVKPYSSVSIALIALCALVAAASNLGASRDALQLLFIATPGSAGLSDVFSGQIWRLITPIFIHFGFLHLAFNMLWVWDLGKLIELKKGVGFYVVFVVVVAALSNLAQYLFARSVFFGGMSGVVYGLFGYIWIRGRYDPKFSADLHKTTVNMMLIWFLLCWTGLLGPIANWAHTAGLLIGAAWAYLGTRSMTPASAADISASAKDPQLEYLSTSDMLQLEEHRRWARAHLKSDAQYRYDSVEGKLRIIESILQQQMEPAIEARLKAGLDTVFGDALIQETGAQWAVFNDDDKRTPVLMTEARGITVFPALMFSKMREAEADRDVRELFHGAVRMIRDAALK
jgi:membrane associated rhomboid family serine protease